MEPTVSEKREKKAKKTRVQNTRRVLELLAIAIEASKYDVKKRADLDYPRVHDAIVTLENKGYVRKVREKIAQNRKPSSIYGLTFKGALQYLSLIELHEPETVFWHNEPQEEITKRYLKSKKAYEKQLEQLMEFLRLMGKALNYPIFAEIDWLAKNYGKTILYRILQSANYYVRNPLPLYKGMERHHRLAMQEITHDIETMKKLPFLQESTIFWTNGKTRVETKVNELAASERKLAENKRLMLQILENENITLKKAFAYEFFHNLGTLYKAKKTSGRNEPLAIFAKDLLEERRNSLVPLEKVVEMVDKERIENV